MPLELPATSTESKQKRAANSRRRAYKPARCAGTFCGAHAESADGYWGGPGRKWAERVKISTWLHDVQLEVGARCVGSALVEYPAMTRRHRKTRGRSGQSAGRGSGGMAERRHGSTRVLWNRASADHHWVPGTHQETERAEKASKGSAEHSSRRHRQFQWKFC